MFLGLAMNLFGQRLFLDRRIDGRFVHCRCAFHRRANPSEQALADTLQSFHPLPLTLSGTIGLAVLLWLMMYKPI